MITDEQIENGMKDMEREHPKVAEALRMLAQNLSEANNALLSMPVDLLKMIRDMKKGELPENLARIETRLNTLLEMAAEYQAKFAVPEPVPTVSTRNVPVQ